jgi:hypothetical protein
MLVSTRNPLQVMAYETAYQYITLYITTSIHDISTSHTQTVRSAVVLSVGIITFLYITI